MSRGRVAEDKRRIVKRLAIIFCSATIAECPLEAACISTDAETKKKTMCGYYAGSTTGKDGSQVYCEYQGE